MITDKEGYEAMLHLLKSFQELTGTEDYTDVLSPGVYWPGTSTPADPSFWDYWLDAIAKRRKEGPLYAKDLI